MRGENPTQPRRSARLLCCRTNNAGREPRESCPLLSTRLPNSKRPDFCNRTGARTDCVRPGTLLSGAAAASLGCQRNPNGCREPERDERASDDTTHNGLLARVGGAAPASFSGQGRETRLRRHSGPVTFMRHVSQEQ